MAAVEAKTGREVLRLLEIELNKFENLFQEISGRLKVGVLIEIMICLIFREKQKNTYRQEGR